MRSILQIVQYLYGFISLAGYGVGVGKIGRECRTARRQLDRLLKFRDGLGRYRCFCTNTSPST